MKVKKYYGQNFIFDKNLIKRIVDLLDEQVDLIIEIGPGLGALTCELVKKHKKVIAIEIDKDLKTILEDKIQSSNFELIIDDFLNIDLNDLIKDYKRVQIISNVPYYITSEIIFKIFKFHYLFEKAVLMLQKEVADRICANVNEKHYNNLSIISNVYGQIKYEFFVSKTKFKPIPKVNSAIISLNFLKSKVNDFHNVEDFNKFLKALFNNKRKTISNNLAIFLNDKQKALNILNILNIDIKKRPENLAYEDFKNLYFEQKKQIK